MSDFADLDAPPGRPYDPFVEGLRVRVRISFLGSRMGDFANMDVPPGRPYEPFVMGLRVLEKS